MKKKGESGKKERKKKKKKQRNFTDFWIRRGPTFVKPLVLLRFFFAFRFIN